MFDALDSRFQYNQLHAIIRQYTTDTTVRFNFVVEFHTDGCDANPAKEGQLRVQRWDSEEASKEDAHSF